MKRAILLTILALFVVGGAASAVTYDIALSPGLNMVAPPAVPFNPDPLEVFKDNAGNPIDIDLKLFRWDSVGQGYVYYDQYGDPTLYGGVLLGDGTVLNNANAVGVWRFDGAPDGLPDSNNVMTDMWISLPKAGVTLLGHPFNHNVVAANILVTDGTQTITIDAARTNGWTDAVFWGWDAVGQGYFQVEIDPWAIYTDLEPAHGYVLKTTRDNLALIIPA